MNLFFLVCATKVNIVFMLVFAGSGLGFTLLSGALWTLAEGAADSGAKLLVVCGTQLQSMFRQPALILL